eukprot:scaffold70186_cov37-Prasinocladus_malaysianus.AAC.2
MVVRQLNLSETVSFNFLSISALSHRRRPAGQQLVAMTTACGDDAISIVDLWSSLRRRQPENYSVQAAHSVDCYSNCNWHGGWNHMAAF